VTVSVPGDAPAAYGWSAQDGTSRLRRSDGSVAEYIRGG
jgi:hypothetical protein